jgi:hypothetical protein
MASRKGGAKSGESASDLIDGRIKELDDWRGTMLGRLRALIKAGRISINGQSFWQSPRSPSAS